MSYRVRSLRLVGLRLFAATLVTGLVAVAVLPTQAADAGTGVVTTCSGSASTPGSLPYEVINAISGETISFSVSCPPGSPIDLASTIDINEKLTIDGSGPSTVAVSGGGSVEVFDVESGATAATISGLTIEDGSTESGGGGPGGGGIYNDGVLSIINSTLSDNQAGGLLGGNGGGIENAGTLTVSGTTLSGNTAITHARTGGGVNNDGTLTVIDSTFSDNQSMGGGDIENDVGGTAKVTSSTLSGGSAPPGSGGGIGNAGTASLAATIVADNSSGGDCGGTITDAGYNLDDDGSCAFSPANHSQSDVDPELGSLQDNGGPNETEAPANAPGNPALNRIPTGAVGNSTTLCPGLDETQTYRPQGPECDVGAVEDPLPRVSGVSPTTGLNTGSTPVTISGSGFTGATAVHFGTFLATIMVVGPETITVSSPPQSPGPEDVTVTTPVGTSDTNPADVFVYGENEPPITGNCDPTCTVTGSSPDPTATTASGSSGTVSNASISLVAPSQDTLMSCGGAYDYDAPVWTLSTTGFISTTPLTVSETVQGEPSTAGVKVCYEGLSSSTPMFLRQCAATPVAPCLQSLTESMDSVTADFYAPSNDPRFWTGNAAVAVAKFSPAKGVPGSKVTIKGSNFKAVNAVVIAGIPAQIDKQTNGKLKVTIPQTDVAESGFITVVADSNRAVSTDEFTITP